MKSKLTHAVAVITCLMLVIWGTVLILMAVNNSPNLMTALTPFGTLVTVAVVGFYKFYEGQKPDGKP